VVLSVAEKVAEVAPDAWIVDFTNPVGIVTRALLDAGHRAIGLCNVAIGFQRRFAALLGVEPAAVSLDHVGLNHLTWERAAYVDGVNVLPALIAKHGPALAEQVDLPVRLLHMLGVVPSYYLRYFYEHDAVVREQLVAPSRATAVSEVERKLLRIYADPTVDTKPDLLGKRGGAFYSEAAVALLTSLLGGQVDTHVVNIRNDGTFPFLADDAVIEVPATVSKEGATANPITPVDPLYSGLIANVSAYEELALRAAIGGDEDLVVRALLAHPLVGQADKAIDLARRVITAHRAYLPWAVA
jgi:6-phospho-beta-glucosidase